MFVFLLTKDKSPDRMKLNLINCHNSSYNLGDMAQKFLPSYRKWLDYEVKNHGWQSINLLPPDFLVCLQSTPGNPRRFSFWPDFLNTIQGEMKI
ncbi:hypothetical protein G3A_15725 [Bacillus sp. 17376]|nr:hypothetical protein G3A_15725 [Bacillus sp. 17376]